MPTVLGRDVKASFAARLRGRLYPATLTRNEPGTYDANDPSAGPTPASTPYACEAIAFSFDTDEIQGEQVASTDYLVTIILGTIRDPDTDELVDYSPKPGDTIAVPPPGNDAPQTGTITGIRSKTNAAVTCVVGGFVDG